MPQFLRLAQDLNFSKGLIVTEKDDILCFWGDPLVGKYCKVQEISSETGRVSISTTKREEKVQEANGFKNTDREESEGEVEQ